LKKKTNSQYQENVKELRVLMKTMVLLYIVGALNIGISTFAIIRYRKSWFAEFMVYPLIFGACCIGFGLSIQIYVLK